MPSVEPTPAKREPLSVNQTEAARLIGVPVRTLRQWTAQGKVNSGKVGRRRLYPMSELRRLSGER